MGLKTKLYEDFFKPNRLPSYEKTLLHARHNGYKMLGILDFYQIVLGDPLFYENGVKYLLNRHDIDTSPRVAREMFEIEKRVYGKDGSATYYFRDSTTDLGLIKEIDAYGYEAAYHYEELATYEKKHKFKNTRILREHLPEMGQQFITDIEKFRSITGVQSVSVASHGDFVNTKLQMQSYEILSQDDIRKAASITVEAYDETINKYVKARFADQILVARFSEEVIKSIDSNCPIILMLTHPRNWKVDIRDNIRENFVRLIQGISYEV